MFSPSKIIGGPDPSSPQESKPMTLSTESEQSIDLTLSIDQYSLPFIFVIECRNSILFLEISNYSLLFHYRLPTLLPTSKSGGDMSPRNSVYVADNGCSCTNLLGVNINEKTEATSHVSLKLSSINIIAWSTSCLDKFPLHESLPQKLHV